MPRNKVEKRKVGAHSHEQMQEALQAVKDGKSIRQAATDHNIPFTTLQRYKTKEKETQNQLLRLTPNYAVNQVFSRDQEVILKDYYIKCANLFYGLSVNDCRQVAYEMAKINGIKMPKTWTENRLAGIDWLRGFRQRHPDLTLRKPEACSLARASAFNRETVNHFYDNLEKVIQRHPAFADGTRIYNLDETGTTTVQKTQRIIAPKGRRNLCKVTSGEKGTLVTTCNIISAGGQAVPPVIVFPRKNTNPRMAVGTPPGSLILANPSGWMNSELFLDVMKHFIRRTGTSKEYPSILLMDNHESHLSIEALDLAKESGVIVLTLHPHTSARLQPLDVGIHGPFKTFYYSAMSSWMLRNPGCPITIYDVGALIGQAFAKSMTPLNITHAFKKTGIFPFDRHVFSEEDFAPSSVTDRPENAQPENNSSVELATTDQQQILQLEDNPLHRRITDSPRPSTSTAEEISRDTMSPSLLENLSGTEYSEKPPVPVFTTPEKSVLNVPSDLSLLPLDGSTSQPTVIPTTNNITEINLSVPPRIKSLITPDQFRKPLKAPARNGKRKPRKLGKSLIATDTPEKNAIAKQKAAKRKKEIKCKGKKAIRQVLQSDSEDEMDIVLNDETDDEGDWIETEEEHNITDDLLKRPLVRLPNEGEYILVQFCSKNQKIYFVGKVLEERNISSSDLYVSFLRYKKGKFVMPNVPDLSYVKDEDVRFILPKPTVSGSTSRQQSYYVFPVDLSQINIR
ncbi:uncharacterized protein LOC123879265 [Maniola jurtina]|uniref:uncharacterized protein LOC123879265 n=1 Tax=Maniola jurtina TaxID=191418 RepID=UPI001E68AC15|nr:uncharacterized protein LOC123879265 [Maniola jurtina]